MLSLALHRRTSCHMMLMMYLCYPAVAFSATTVYGVASTRHSILVTNSIPTVNTMRSNHAPLFLRIRGGEDVSIEEKDSEVIERSESALEDDAMLLEEEDLIHTTTTTESQETTLEADTPEVTSAPSSTDQIIKGRTTTIPYIIAAIKCVGASYSAALTTRPIITKALTACLTFGLSDWTAQRLESNSKTSEIKKSVSKPSSNAASKRKSEPALPLQNWKRTIYSAAVGLFYFGPAAHYWYEAVFKLLPGTSLFSTLQKALLGQVIFGPVFTCVFFASSLLQDNMFTFKSWVAQIKKDLLGVWLSGLGYWPLVDMISFGLIPIQFIPLFINLASFIWTVYLSIVANRRAELQ